MSELLAAELFREASESIEVLTAPYDGVVAEARAQRRRRGRAVGVGVLAAVLVVGVVTWATTRSSDHRAAAPVVTRSLNPVAVPWYANGQLHLARVAVRLPQLTDLAQVDGGVVYGDAHDAVAFVGADGTRRMIGRKAPGSRVVASSGENWAAWLAPARSGDMPVLRVFDVGRGRELESLDLGDIGVGDGVGAKLVAIDQHRVFYATDRGSFAWSPETGEAEQLDRAGLVDVESATRVYQRGRQIDMVQPFFSVTYTRPGRGAQISPGGSYVLSAAPGTRADGPYRPFLYDARSGKRLGSGLSSEELATDGTFTGTGAVVYLVAQVADLAGGSDLDGNIDPLLVLRTCDLAQRRCTDEAPVQTGTDRPLLAH